MATKPVKTDRGTHSHTHSVETTNVEQQHLTSSGSRLLPELTPRFDRDENSRHLEIASSYNGTSSSEESDCNQTSVIFSLDELQNSFAGLTSSSPPGNSRTVLNNTADRTGLLFPSLVQDEDGALSMSSKDEQERDQGYDLNFSPPSVDPVKKRNDSTNATALKDTAIIDSEVTKLLAEVNSIAQPDNVAVGNTVNVTDTSKSHLDSVVDNAVCLNISNASITVHPKLSLSYTPIDGTNLTDVTLDNHVNPVSNSSEPSPIITPHVETSSGVVTITEPSPNDTPVAVHSARLSPVSLSSSDAVSIHPEKVLDVISTPGSVAGNGSKKSVSEKLKPTLNTFESPGLLYAHPVKKSSKIVEAYEPAEAATDTLLSEEEKLPTVASRSEGHHHVRAKADKRGELFVDQTQLSPFNYKHITGIPIYYPPDRGSNMAAADEMLLNDSALKDIEGNAKKVAENLDYMLDNLRNSLHAMATCTKLSVSLHKEAIDDMHVTVDESIKMMYAFLAKFEELNQNMKPIEALAAQIKDVSESLKVLEKAIR